MLQFGEILDDFQAVVVAFFGVGLEAVDVFVLDGGDELVAVVGFADGVAVVGDSVERVDEVEIECIRQTLK